ncbi:MAG: CHRD domain-containing protein [Gemmatimonadaceae bacterium]|nr:CHRD domain-containing protein [Gemmatimonadaceae bacterium]
MRLSSALFVCAFGAMSLVACGDDDDATTPARERYVVTLNGLNEKPNAVTTTATGSAVVTVLSPDSIEWVVYVSGMDSITAGHFHAGDVNSSGPVMYFTFGGPTTGRGVTGVLNSGIATRQSTFSGVFNYDSLLKRIRAGTTYLNVHTRRYPPGEIRGQVSP